MGAVPKNKERKNHLRGFSYVPEMLAFLSWHILKLQVEPRECGNDWSIPDRPCDPWHPLVGQVLVMAPKGSASVSASTDSILGLFLGDVSPSHESDCRAS